MIDFRHDAHQMQIDRMVDGELTPLEQQTLLRSLDARTDGWKDLALAYVESRAMRESLRGWSGNDAVASSPVRETAAVPKSNGGRWRWVANSVASVCAALAVTLAAVHWWNRDVSAGRTVSRSPRASLAPYPTVATVLNDNGHPAENDVPRQSLELPVVSAADVNPQRLSAAPPIITPELRAALRRTGHIVNEERRVYPVVLKDGRRVLIPVNEIKVKYVGNILYQ